MFEHGRRRATLAEDIVGGGRHAAIGGLAARETVPRMSRPTGFFDGDPVPASFSVQFPQTRFFADMTEHPNVPGSLHRSEGCRQGVRTRDRRERPHRVCRRRRCLSYEDLHPFQRRELPPKVCCRTGTGIRLRPPSGPSDSRRPHWWRVRRRARAVSRKLRI